MKKPKIVFYAVGTLPHYLPLYLAAEELTKDTSSVIVEWKEILGGTESLHLFDRAARDSQKSDTTLQIVLSGQVEHIFDQNVATSALVDQFVAASVFIHRVPLWLLCEKKHAPDIRTVLMGGAEAKWPTAFVPKQGTTLYQEFDEEFGSENFQLEELDDGLAIHDEIGVLELTAESMPQGPWVFASLFPIATNELTILNDRLPTKTVGFTTLWLWKETVYNEDLMSVFRAFAEKLHALVRELYDLDCNILTSRNSELMEELTGGCKEWLTRHEATAKSRAFVKLATQPWWNSRHRFLAHFLLDRIWDTDFNFVRPATQDAVERRYGSGDVLYHRSLAASYRSANIGAIRNAFGKSLEIVSSKLGVLKEITDTVERLNQRLHLSEAPLVPFDRALYQIQDFLKIVFARVGWHTVRDYYDQSTNVLKPGAGASLVEAARELKEAVGVPGTSLDADPASEATRSNSTTGARVAWISTLFESIPRLEKDWEKKKADCQMTGLLVERIHEVLKVVAKAISGSDLDAAYIQAALAKDLIAGSRSLLLCELKALSQRYIPISWFLCLDARVSLADILENELSVEEPDANGRTIRQSCFYGVGGEGTSNPNARIHHMERNIATFLELLASCGSKRANNFSGAKGGAVEVTLSRPLFASGDGFLEIELLYLPDRPGSPDSFSKLAAIAYGLPREEGMRYGQDSHRLLQLRDFGLKMNVVHKQSSQASIVVTMNNKIAREFNTI